MLSNSYIDKSDLTIHRPNDTRASQKIVHYYTKRLKTFNLNRYLLPNILQWLVTTTKKREGDSRNRTPDTSDIWRPRGTCCGHSRHEFWFNFIHYQSDLKPGTVGQEARTLPLCFAVPLLTLCSTRWV